MKPIIIFGNTQCAELAYFYFKHDSKRKIAGFTVDSSYIKEPTCFSLPLIAFETINESFPPDQYDMFIAMGYSHINKLRTEKYDQAKQKGYHLASYISTKATILCEKEHIGDNAFILEDNTIQPYVKIGNNVTLWSGNHVGHHSQIGNNCFIASHVVISGNVQIFDKCFIGVNATLRDGITVGESAVIGAGCWINKNVEPYAVYTTPAAERRKQNSSQLKGI